MMKTWTMAAAAMLAAGQAALAQDGEDRRGDLRDKLEERRDRLQELRE